MLKKFVPVSYPVRPIKNRVNVKRRLRAIKKIAPNMKIFVFICDPVKRLFSQLTHCIRENNDGCKGHSITTLIVKVCKLFTKLDNESENVYNSEKVFQIIRTEGLLKLSDDGITKLLLKYIQETLENIPYIKRVFPPMGFNHWPLQLTD